MPIVFNDVTGQTLYARFDDTSNTAVNLTEGTSLKVGRYTASDASIVTAALAAGTYSARIFVGTAAAQANTDYQAGVIGEFIWDGTNETTVGGLLEDATTVSADVISPKRTWIAEEYRATNIVEVKQNFAGPLALKPDLNPNTVILSVTSVSITGAATVTATSLEVDRSRTLAHFTVPALSTVGTYTVLVTLTTVDGQTIPTTATLKVY